MHIKRLFIIGILIFCILLPTAHTFADTDSGAAEAELTDAERAAIAASVQVPVSVAVVDSSAPLCFRHPKTGEFDGICVDMLQTVSEKTGLQFTYLPVNLDRSDLLGNPDEKSPDLVAGILHNADVPDDRGLKLSDALIKERLVFVSRRGTDFTKNPETKTIAVMKGFTLAFRYIETSFPKHTVAIYESLPDCMDAVAEGRADATVYLKSCIDYLLQKPHYGKLEIVSGLEMKADICVAMVRADKEVLLSIIDKGLALIIEDERFDMTMSNTIMNPYELATEDILYRYRVPIAVIACLIIAIIASLMTLISVRRKSAEKLQAALDAAKKASAAKGSFMSRMSHEIRTPLNAVIGYNSIARGALAGVETESELRRASMNVMDCLTKSDIASKHLLTVINDVLDMSTIESGRIRIMHERFDLRNLISSLTVLFYSQAETKGVHFEVIVGQMTEEWFIGDHTRINQILANLLSNAVKFTPAGGDVTLRVTLSPVDDEKVQILFSVSDTGIGMDEAYLTHIWTPFEQADGSISRRFGGTGLGLSITKTLVELMDGTIEVESEKNVGSKFSVSLTLTRTEQPETVGQFDFTGIRALIVDDDRGTCEYVKLLFDRCGVRSSTATSGMEALDLLTAAIKADDHFTICIVDWQMPHMDGMDTVKRIRQIAGNELPIIIVTAYDFSAIEASGRAVGVNQFVSKPLFQSSVFDLLASIAGKKAAKGKPAKSKREFTDISVLLAEDNEMNMEIAKMILTESGLSVVCALNGRDAVTMFETAPAGTYSAILMDVHMPEMDGYQATRCIRKSHRPDGKTIPIIAMTADAFTEDVEEAMAAGMNDHVPKPIDPNVLLDALHRRIGQ